jgi:hypothetical protein
MTEPTPTNHAIVTRLLGALLALAAGSGAVVVAVLLLHTVLG